MQLQTLIVFMTAALAGSSLATSDSSAHPGPARIRGRARLRASVLLAGSSSSSSSPSLVPSFTPLPSQSSAIPSSVMAVPSSASPSSMMPSASSVMAMLPTSTGISARIGTTSGGQKRTPSINRKDHDHDLCLSLCSTQSQICSLTLPNDEEWCWDLFVGCNQSCDRQAFR
ncbi:hypothetical protein VTN77DRAFT_9116 [Rasamsonia byssochlamydoides]|uniref:uncharacterized protein n=1 Tax=Rasamsonia byssochlamydoides TaxID=89139 RepID=UPI0037445169